MTTVHARLTCPSSLQAHSVSFWAPVASIGMCKILLAVVQIHLIYLHDIRVCMDLNCVSKRSFALTHKAVLGLAPTRMHMPVWHQQKCVE